MADFEVYINGELAHTVKGADHTRVSEVKLLSAQGAAGSINVPMEMQRVDLEITVRDTMESNYLDLQTEDARRTRAEELEKASADRVAEGRKQMADEAPAEEKTASKSTKKEEAVSL